MRVLLWSYPTSIILFSLCLGVTADDGFLTYYGPSTGVASTSNGACGYGDLGANNWPYGQYASISPNNSLAQALGANNLACGQCIQTQCKGSGCIASAKATVLYVTDRCDCDNNQLTVPRDVFLASFGASVSIGRVNITYKQVACQPGANIAVKVLQARADGGGYIALILLNVAGNGGILGVDLRPNSSANWRPLVNTYGNVWEGSNLGSLPFDLRLTAFDQAPLVLQKAVPSLQVGVYPSQSQLNAVSPSPSIAPRASPRAAMAPSPSDVSIVYSSNSSSTISLSGIRIDVPLYFAPLDLSLLGGYPGVKFTFRDCPPSQQSVNVTVDRSQPLDSNPGGLPSVWTIRAIRYAPVAANGSAQIYKLLDSTFFNLETGSIATLYQPVYVSLTDKSFDGVSRSVVDSATNKTVYPRFFNTSSLNTPGDLSYTLLLPPAANEDATDPYLKELTTIFYYLTTLTLGNDGSPTISPSCQPGFPALGAWGDYVRQVIAELAPLSDLAGDQYQRIPLGTNYMFLGRSFVLNNVLISGRTVNTTTQLSASDCGVQCRSLAGTNATACNAWAWCSSIAGCGSSAYQACDLKSSTSAENVTNTDGSLNTTSNRRFTSGTLVLPAPLGIDTLYSANSSTASTGGD